MKELSPKRPTVRELFEGLKEDPDFWLQGAVQELVETGNPYFAWRAIQVCIEHRRQFPEWLLAYLEECSKRMLSDEAKKAGRDLRKILPWALGFPNVLDSTERKRGPGNLLDPHGDPDRGLFAIKFGKKLEEGQELSSALRDACNEVFSGKLAEVDNKTLRRWLCKEFGLSAQPANAGEWKNAAREHYRAILEGLAAWKKSRETPS